VENKIKKPDQKFYEQLRAHLMVGDQEPVEIPIKFKRDGSINRERTLAMACYEGLVVKP
jgi:hypothetical protein